LCNPIPYLGLQLARCVWRQKKVRCTRRRGAQREKIYFSPAFYLSALTAFGVDYLEIDAQHSGLAASCDSSLPVFKCARITGGANLRVGAFDLFRKKNSILSRKNFLWSFLIFLEIYFYFKSRIKLKRKCESWYM